MRLRALLVGVALAGMIPTSSRIRADPLPERRAIGNAFQVEECRDADPLNLPASNLQPVPGYRDPRGQNVADCIRRNPGYDPKDLIDNMEPDSTHNDEKGR